MQSWQTHPLQMLRMIMLVTSNFSPSCTWETLELSVSCIGAGNQITLFASSNKLLLSILKQTIQGGSQALMTFTP